MALGDSISKNLSYLYERLLCRLSDEGFRDPVSAGSFLVILTFCTQSLVVLGSFQEPLHLTEVATLLSSAHNEEEEDQAGLSEKNSTAFH